MIKEVITYTIICDGCGADSCDGLEYVGWHELDCAIDLALDDGWIELDGKHYCSNCHYYSDDDELLIKQ